MTRAEEQRLIQRAAAGDREAAEVFLRANQASLYAYMMRLCGRPDVAMDIVQDAFVRVLTNLNRFDPKYRFSTWLFTIARRLYLNSVQKMSPTFSSEVVGASIENSPVGYRSDSELGVAVRDDLQRALMSLSLEQREILILFHQQDWPIWLIAQHLEIPEGTVKSHLHRGRKRLKELITSRADTLRHVQEVWS